MLSSDRTSTAERPGTSEDGPLPQEPAPLGITLYPSRGKRPNWPLVIGINSCVVACVLLLYRFFICSMALKATWLALLLGTLLDVILLAGAIAMIQRKDIGRSLHIIWAAISLIPMSLYLVLAISVLRDIKMLLAVAVVILFMAVYPIFILIWMTRRRARRDMRHW